MDVITRLYDSYSDARRAVDAVKALGLSGVEASVLGNESLRTLHEGYEGLPYDAAESQEGTFDPARRDLSADDPAYRDPAPYDPDRRETGASGAAAGAGVGAALGGGAGLLAGLGMLAIPGLGPVVAAGWLAAAAVGAAAGGLAGGALGALTDLGIPEEDAPVYGEAIRRGHVVVSVRAPLEHRIAVENALETVNPHHIDALRARYETEGWRAEETAEERAARNHSVPPYL